MEKFKQTGLFSFCRCGIFEYDFRLIEGLHWFWDERNSGLFLN